MNLAVNVRRIGIIGLLGWLVQLQLLEDHLPLECKYKLKTIIFSFSWFSSRSHNVKWFLLYWHTCCTFNMVCHTIILSLPIILTTILCSKWTEPKDKVETGNEVQMWSKLQLKPKMFFFWQYDLELYMETGINRPVIKGCSLASFCVTQSCESLIWLH